MSKARKLQLEVESTLKKVHEGSESWGKEWAKLQSLEDITQRDKIIEGLKRDLKKLQRLREQVRGWLATGEVKGQDDALQEARRTVERHMVRTSRLSYTPFLFNFYTILRQKFHNNILYTITHTNMCAYVAAGEF